MSGRKYDKGNRDNERNNGRKKNNSGGGGYNPLRPSYPSRKRFYRESDRMARQQIRPQLQQVNRDRRYEESAHDERNRDLGDWYGGEAQNRTNALGALDSSLNQLAATSANTQGANTQAMLAALGRSRVSDDALSQQLLGQSGGIVETVPGQGAAQQAALMDAAQRAFANQSGAAMERGAANLGRVGLERTRALEDESEQHQFTIGDLQHQRQQLLGQQIGLAAQARSELAGLAGQGRQLDLEDKQFRYTKRQNKKNRQDSKKAASKAKKKSSGSFSTKGM